MVAEPQPPELPRTTTPSHNDGVPAPSKPHDAENGADRSWEPNTQLASSHVV
jgi:hypothetical protein